MKQCLSMEDRQTSLTIRIISTTVPVFARSMTEQPHKQTLNLGRDAIPKSGICYSENIKTVSGSLTTPVPKRTTSMIKEV